MTTFYIKLLAIVLMLIDHIGLFFFPDMVLLRVIGRGSFPLIGWLIANGAYHSKNLTHYLYRLLFFAFLSQIPFLLATELLDLHASGLNVIFTLSLGLLGIISIKKTSMPMYWLLITLLCIAAQFLNTEYGAFGVLMIVIFYIFFRNWKYMFIVEAVLFVTNSFIGLLLHQVLNLLGFFGLFALVFIYFYNNKQGPKMKYLFYIFYPLQYLVFYLLTKYLK